MGTAMASLGALLRASLSSLVTVGFVLALAVNLADARHPAPGGCSLAGWEPRLCARSMGPFPPARTLPRGHQRLCRGCRGFFVLILAWDHPTLHLEPSREPGPLETLCSDVGKRSVRAEGPAPAREVPESEGVCDIVCCMPGWVRRFARAGAAGAEGVRTGSSSRVPSFCCQKLSSRSHAYLRRVLERGRDSPRDAGPAGGGLLERGDNRGEGGRHGGRDRSGGGGRRGGDDGHWGRGRGPHGRCRLPSAL